MKYNFWKKFLLVHIYKFDDLVPVKATPISDIWKYLTEVFAFLAKSVKLSSVQNLYLKMLSIKSSGTDWRRSTISGIF